jgi:hypothetical protein
VNGCDDFVGLALTRCDPHSYLAQRIPVGDSLRKRRDTRLIVCRKERVLYCLQGGDASVAFNDDKLTITLDHKRNFVSQITDFGDSFNEI